LGHHVLTVLGGFGLRVIPYAPFRARIGSTARVLEIERSTPARSARVIVEREGACDVELGDGTADSADVFDIEVGPKHDAWFLETSLVSFRLPERFTMHSVADGSPSPFDLVGESGDLIYVQTASRRVALRELVRTGVSVVEEDRELLEVEYEHDGTIWRQRHRLVLPSVGRTFVLTAQSPADRSANARAALDLMADSACLTDETRLR
jgi:hypothetical protein